MSIVKYRLREVAADFGVTPKQIAQIMEQFFEKPKSNTQVLTDEELNVIFDVITQENQISDLSQVFAVQPKAKTEEPKAEEPKAEEKKAEQPAKKEQKKEQPAPKKEQPAQEGENAPKKNSRRNHHRRRKPRSGEGKSE